MAEMLTRESIANALRRIGVANVISFADEMLAGQAAAVAAERERLAALVDSLAAAAAATEQEARDCRAHPGAVGTYAGRREAYQWVAAEIRGGQDRDRLPGS